MDACVGGALSLTKGQPQWPGASCTKSNGQWSKRATVRRARFGPCFSGRLARADEWACVETSSRLVAHGRTNERRRWRRKLLISRIARECRDNKMDNKSSSSSKQRKCCGQFHTKFDVATGSRQVCQPASIKSSQLD